MRASFSRACYCLHGAISTERQECQKKVEEVPKLYPSSWALVANFSCLCGVVANHFIFALINFDGVR